LVSQWNHKKLKLNVLSEIYCLEVTYYSVPGLPKNIIASTDKKFHIKIGGNMLDGIEPR
jgi:hypothetical protein